MNVNVLYDALVKVQLVELVLKAEGMSTEDIQSNWQADREFLPVMEEEERSRRLKGWNKAVKCAFAWAKDDE